MLLYFIFRVSLLLVLIGAAVRADNLPFFDFSAGGAQINPIQPLYPIDFSGPSAAFYEGVIFLTYPVSKQFLDYTLGGSGQWQAPQPVDIGNFIADDDGAGITATQTGFELFWTTPGDSSSNLPHTAYNSYTLSGGFGTAREYANSEGSFYQPSASFDPVTDAISAFHNSASRTALYETTIEPDGHIEERGVTTDQPLVGGIGSVWFPDIQQTVTFFGEADGLIHFATDEEPDRATTFTYAEGSSFAATYFSYSNFTNVVILVYKNAGYIEYIYLDPTQVLWPNSSSSGYYTGIQFGDPGGPGAVVVANTLHLYYPGQAATNAYINEAISVASQS